MKTFWNKLKYWQKGLVVGVVCFVAFSLFLFLVSGGVCAGEEERWPTSIGIPGLPHKCTFTEVLQNMYRGFFTTVLVSTLIGYIIGKFKKSSEANKLTPKT